MKKTISALIIGLICATNTTLANAEDLLSVYNQAQKNDPTVLKSKALYNASKEGIVQARSVLLPGLSGSAGYLKSKGGVEGNTTSKTEQMSYGLTLSMDLYKHSSWLKLDNAKKSAHQSDVSYQVAKQDLIVRVTTAYFDVLSAKDDLDFAKAEKAAIERQLEQTKQRYSVGLTAVLLIERSKRTFVPAEFSVMWESRLINALLVCHFPRVFFL